MNCCLLWGGIISFIIGGLLLSGGLVVQLLVFPNTMTDTINDMKVIGVNGDGTLNDFAAAWANPTYISNTEFYIYDYANVGGIMNRGTYPDMDERGPYTYKTIITNEVVSWEDDYNTVNYYQRYVYQFDSSKSCKGCDPMKDKVKVPDMAYQLIVNMLPSKAVCKKPAKGSLDETICNSISDDVLDNIDKGGILLSLFNIEPFIDVTVDELLFSGYTTPIVESLKEADLFAFTFLNDNVDLRGKIENLTDTLSDIKINYMTTNNTLQFFYTAETGKADPARTGFIKGFNGTDGIYKSSEGDLLPSSWWNPPQDDKKFCPDQFGIQSRYINGTIGDFFQSFITKSDTLYLYVADICRSIKLQYDSEVTVKGINGLRFVFAEEALRSDLPENCGYCKKLPRDFHSLPEGSRCLPDGYLDMSGCMSIPIPDHDDLPLPVVASLPHFYQSDPSTKFVPRFNPSSINDATTLDIEPLSGTLLQANKRMQINLYIGQSKHTAFNSLKVMRSGAYPLFWLNQTALIDDNSANLVTTSMDPMNWVPIVCWVCVGVGAALILVSLILFCKSCGGSSNKKDD